MWEKRQDVGKQLGTPESGTEKTHCKAQSDRNRSQGKS